MNHKTFHELSLVLLTILVLLAAGATVAQPGDIPRQDPGKADIDPVLQTAEGFSTMGSEPQDVIVRLEDFEVSDRDERKRLSSTHQSPIVNMADRNPKVEVIDNFWLINAVHLRVDSDFPLENIAGVRGVERLHHNIQVRSLETENVQGAEHGDSTYGLDHINATEVWTDFDTKGEDVRVSVLDSGIDPDHPDLDLYTDDESDPTFPGGWVEYDDGRVEGSEPYDCETHGTHVSGTVAGEDESGENIGVAPNIELMHGGVLMQGFECTGEFTDIISGMEWSVDNDADVISMSLGAEAYIGDMISPVRNAEDQGAIVIAAIMNEGEGTSGSPGNVYDTFSVGATNEFYQVRDFSSGELIDTEEDWGTDAPNDWPSEYIVPNVVAPGSSIQSTMPGGDYDTKSGTSMAAPHVSGAAALMQSATVERLTPREIKKSFLETAWKPDDWDESEAQASIGENDSRYGKGIIDAYAATEYAVENFDQEFEIRDLSINESEVNVTDSFNVSGEIENFRSDSIEVELELKFNDTLDDSKNISLQGNETSSFHFVSSISNEGLYDVTVNNQSAGMIDVLMPPPDFSIGANLEDTEIIEGGSAVVSGQVDNDGGDGIADLRLLSNDSEINSTNLNIDFESSESFSFENTFNSPGSYELKVNNTDAGNLTVLEDSDLNIADLSLNSTDPFFEEETVAINVTGENTGEVDDDLTFELRVDGELHGSEERFIEAGGQETVNFQHMPMERGNYTYSSGGLEETLEVLKEGSVELINSSLAENEIVEGENFTYILETNNPGDVETSSTLEFIEDSVVYESRNVEIGANSSKTFNSTKEITEPGEYDIGVNGTLIRQVNVLEEAKLNQTGLTVEESSFVEGENLSAQSTVENVGEVEGNFSIPFNITGEESSDDTVEVSIGPSEEVGVNFTREMNVPGEYSLQSLNESMDFTVLEDADIQVQNASLNSSSIFTGNIVEANTTVENVGEVSGETSLNISLDREKTVNTGSVEPGSQVNVTENFRPTNEGDYNLSVDEANYTELEVLRPEVNLGNNSFNVSDLGLVDIDFIVNNTDHGYVNETVEASANDTEVSDTFNLGPDEEKNVSLSLDLDLPGFYVLELNQTEVGNFSLDPFAEFSDLAPEDGSVFDEDDSVEISGSIESVGEPNLTVEVDDQVFESEQGSGATSFSFENVYSPGVYEWSALAEFGNSSFESSNRAFEVEEIEEDEDDSSSGGGSEGGGGGAPAPSEEETELSVEETQDSVRITAPEGSYSLEFNETGLPVRSVEFEASEDGTMNFTSSDVTHSGSMESIFDAETSWEGSYTLGVELSKQWIEENQFATDQASFYRFEDGWNDLEPGTVEEDDYILFETVLDSFSTFGTGVDQACYSMNEVEAVVDDSCMTFDNICEVPEEAEVVDSCSEFERTSNIEQRIQDLENSEESSEQLEEAEQALERGDIETAESILENVEQQPEEEREVPYLLFIGLAGFGLITAIILFVVVRPYYRKKKLVSRLASATSKIEERAEKGEDFQFAAEKVAEANKALIEEDYDKAEKVLDDVELVF